MSKSHFAPLRRVLSCIALASCGGVQVSTIAPSTTTAPEGALSVRCEDVALLDEAADTPSTDSGDEGALRVTIRNRQRSCRRPMLLHESDQDLADPVRGTLGPHNVVLVGERVEACPEGEVCDGYFRVVWVFTEDAELLGCVSVRVTEESDGFSALETLRVGAKRFRHAGDGLVPLF